MQCRLIAPTITCKKIWLSWKPNVSLLFNLMNNQSTKSVANPGQGPAPPPLIFGPNLRPKGPKKNFFQDCPPSSRAPCLGVWMTGPLPYLKAWMNTLTWLMSVKCSEVVYMLQNKKLTVTVEGKNKYVLLKFHLPLTSFKDLNFPQLVVNFPDFWNHDLFPDYFLNCGNYVCCSSPKLNLG